VIKLPRATVWAIILIGIALFIHAAAIAIYALLKKAER